MSMHSATPEPWDRPLREFPGLVHLAPPVSHLDDSLTRVIETFARDSGAGGVFVVDADDRLLGCIREHTLDFDLVTLVLPQRLWSSVRNFETRQVLRAARPAPRRAKDLMTPTRSVTAETSLKDVLALMTRTEEPAAALVDGAGRFLGYVRRFEVLAHFVRHSN